MGGGGPESRLQSEEIQGAVQSVPRNCAGKHPTSAKKGQGSAEGEGRRRSCWYVNIRSRQLF